MNFEDSPQEALYRAQARAWLDANAEKRPPGEERFRDRYENELEALEKARAFQALKAAAGYAGITLPKAVGGVGGAPIEELIYRQEEARYRVDDSFFEVGLGTCIPAVAEFGSSAQRARYIAPALRGDEIWCQLFSEPSAGSDLAAIITRADRDGDGWRVSGQKVWTTGAQHAAHGLALVRTDAKAPLHAGLTALVVDMSAPGVSVRPIRQLTGEGEFCEVFLTDVYVADTQRLGAEGAGWKVATATLSYERLAVGRGLGLLGWRDLVRAARRVNRMDDASVRERIADNWLIEAGQQYLSYRAQTALSQGRAPGPEQSIHKLVTTQAGQSAANFLFELLGDEIDAEAGLRAKIERGWAWAAALRIAGGADEILRNVIAERVLGLPRDPRGDRKTGKN